MMDLSLALKTLACLWRRRVPGQLVIQFTDYCNARCPQCGMRVTEKFPRSKLSLGDVKRILDAAAARGVEVVSFTGGEPFLFLDELAELLQYAGQAGMRFIRTGTNGFLFKDPEQASFESRVERTAEMLAATPVRNFWISIDSAHPAVHEQMRGLPGVISGIERALKVFHERGVYPSANLGINRWVGGDATKGLRREDFVDEQAYLRAFHTRFSTAFEDFFLQVIDLGFTTVNMCYPMSVDDNEDDDALKPVYQATSNEDVVRFTKTEKAVLFQTLLETIPKFRSKIRVFTPLSSLYALFRHCTNDKEAPYPCRGGIDFFFIDSRDGNTYPCGYRGTENLGRYWAADMTPAKKTDCRLCDWECFRDPSELFGPMLHGRSSPSGLLRKFRRDKRYLSLWLDDLRYYRACSFFDGRAPIERDRMKRWNGTSS